MERPGAEPCTPTGGALSRAWLLVWAGQTTSVFGDCVHLVAQSWYVFSTTGSYAKLGVVNLCAIVPWMVLGWLGGAAGDRFDRRRLLVVCDLVRAAAVGVLPVLLAAGRLRLWHMCLITVMMATMRAMFDPTLLASIPTIVGRERVYQANSMVTLSTTLASMFGMAVGGFLVDAWGPAPAFALNAGSFAVSGVTLWLARFGKAVEGAKRLSQDGPPAACRSLAESLRGAVSFLRGNPWLMWVEVISVSINFAVAPFSVLLPGYSKEVLRAGANGVGLVHTGISAGILAASLLGPLVPRLRNQMACVALSLLGIGTGFAGMGASRGIAAAVSCAAVCGLGIGAGDICILSLMQRTIPDEIQGSLHGLSNTLTLGLRPVGVALGSLLAGSVGVTRVLVGCGMLILAVDGAACLAGLTSSGLLAAVESEGTPRLPGGGREGGLRDRGRCTGANGRSDHKGAGRPS